LEQRNQEMSLLSTLGELLQTCHTSDEAYTAIQRYMPRLLPVASGALYLLAPARDVFEAAVSWGEAPPGVAFFAPDACWALRRGRIHVGQNLHADLPCQHLTEPLACSLCVPMLAEGATMGLLHACGGSTLPRDMPQFAETIAAHLALALSNLK